MKDELYNELIESVRQGGRILRGESRGGRRTEVREPDVAAIREAYNLSQEQFATLLGISVRTLQNWEQGRRRPQGAARVLLRVAEKHPDAVLDTVRKASSIARVVCVRAAKGGYGTRHITKACPAAAHPCGVRLAGAGRNEGTASEARRACLRSADAALRHAGDAQNVRRNSKPKRLQVGSIDRGQAFRTRFGCSNFG